MKIREALLNDPVQSRATALRIAKYASESPENMSELMQCFLSNDYRLAQRAAWSVRWTADYAPDMIYPHLGELVSRLSQTGIHPAVIRNSLRILEDLDYPETFHGPVMDACFRFLSDRSMPVAIKAFSLTILFNLSKQYPDIRKELQIIIEESIDFETAAFQSRGRKILKAFRKQKV